MKQFYKSFCKNKNIMIILNVSLSVMGLILFPLVGIVPKENKENRDGSFDVKTAWGSV